MQVCDVVLISTPVDVDLVLVHTGSVTPPRRWLQQSSFKLDFFACDGRISFLDKAGKVKDANVAHVHIFTVAPAKGDDTISTHSAGCVKSLRVETLRILKSEKSPLLSLKIEGPNVLKISKDRSFASANDHELPDETRSMVSASDWHRLRLNLAQFHVDLHLVRLERSLLTETWWQLQAKSVVESHLLDLTSAENIDSVNRLRVSLIVLTSCLAHRKLRFGWTGLRATYLHPLSQAL